MFMHYMVIVFVLAFIIYILITDKFVRLIIKVCLQSLYYAAIICIVFLLFVEAAFSVFSK